MRAITIFASACIVTGSATETSKPSTKSHKVAKSDLPLTVGHSKADEAYRTAHAAYKASLKKASGLMESLKGAVTKLRSQAKSEFEKESKQLTLLEKDNKAENLKMEKTEKEYESKIESIISKHKHASSLLETKPVFDLSGLKEWKKKLQEAMSKLDQWKAPKSSSFFEDPENTPDEDGKAAPAVPSAITPSFIQVKPFDLVAEKEHLKEVERDLTKATDKLASTPVIPTESEARTRLTAIQNKISKLAEKLNSDIIKTNEKIQSIRKRD